MRFSTNLPIDAVVPAVEAAAIDGRNLVLVAPPGAGKTTRIPLVLLDAPWRGDGRIILLEPRRLAARAAAERMAGTLNSEVGGIVGLRMRLGSKVSAATRIEVVTEGVFARMILDDPSLEGVAAVIFDEFHERSLDADLGLALALECQEVLREDLRILVMSATLDGARVARLLGDAPVIESQGRSHPVETRHRPRDPSVRMEDDVAAVILEALGAEQGSILAFLPGQAEIRRVRERLASRLPAGVDLADLHGGLDTREQDRAIAPSPTGRRKVVLATSIAETSLTIEGVRVVVDSGLARVPVFEPGTGLTRLATVKVSRAAADQRRGRAGRTEPGTCYRLWEEAATNSLEAFARPEILSADLTGLVLDLAAWGTCDTAGLAWLDSPPLPAVSEARHLLTRLGALDEEGRITERGRAMRALPLLPRLATMVMDAADTRLAADIAVLLVERGLGGSGLDLAHRLSAYRADRSRRANDARTLARRWAETVHKIKQDGESIGAVLARAYPDRIGQARGQTGSFRLANGRGASLDPLEALARDQFIVAADVTGSAAAARIMLAAAITREEIEAIFQTAITQEEEVTFDPQAAAVRARLVRRLGALVLDERPLMVQAGDAQANALAEGIAILGIERLPWTGAQRQMRDRVLFMRRTEPDAWPDMSNEGLARSVTTWLVPYLTAKTSLAQINPADIDQALQALLPYDLRRRLDAVAPTHFTAPTGSKLAIDYSSDNPAVSIRVQELFGLDRHPAIHDGRVPLVLELLSPAHRPIQITRDLPGFWRGSWQAVKADMRGRYPKHSWPEDPVSAVPTTRTKRHTPV